MRCFCFYLLRYCFYKKCRYKAWLFFGTGVYFDVNEEAAFKRNTEITRYFKIYLASVRCASIKYFCDLRRLRDWSTIVLVSAKMLR